ncbi:MAG: hypothetical protein ACREA0_20550, partial [bacterium]
MNPAAPLRLDDLYHLLAYIYSEQNSGRSPSVTFAHFVEVCGLLTLHSRSKPRKDDTALVTDALCRALGWFFPLLARFGVVSVEDLVFRKFPNACPYCRQERHDDLLCKNVRDLRPGVVDHDALRDLYRANHSKRPTSLDEWQQMFQRIYPRTLEDAAARSTLGLLEELGELAEAVRVFDRHPKYFAGEAADVFSYLMGIANEHARHVAQKTGGDFSFQAELLRRYPGLCIHCGYQKCACPAVPEGTVGRMAKELDLAPM